jgi:hypothetical protein
LPNNQGKRERHVSVHVLPFFGTIFLGISPPLFFQKFPTSTTLFTAVNVDVHCVRSRRFFFRLAPFFGGALMTMLEFMFTAAVNMNGEPRLLNSVPSFFMAISFLSVDSEFFFDFYCFFYSKTAVKTRVLVNRHIQVHSKLERWLFFLSVASFLFLWLRLSEARTSLFFFLLSVFLFSLIMSIMNLNGLERQLLPFFLSFGFFFFF